MKYYRVIPLVATALVVGFLMARWSFAQPAGQPSAADSKIDHHYGLEELESFIFYLQETKQTNTMQRFNAFLSASAASRLTADMGLNVAILQRLREGKTNAAISLLEGRVDSDIIGFVSSYRDLPEAIREKVSLAVLEMARNYRTNFPVKDGNAALNAQVVDALKLLDEKPAK